MDDDAKALLSIASDFDISGSQYAWLSAALRRAAFRLEAYARAEVDRPCVVPPAAPQLDSDGVPVHGRPCTNCED